MAERPEDPDSAAAETRDPAAGDPNSSHPETLGPETRGPETRGPETRGPESRGAETRGAETRGALIRGAGTRAPEADGPASVPAGRAPDLGSALDRSRPAVAVFVDLENMAWSPDSTSVTFDLGRMMAFLERSTRPVVRKVYADWSRMRDFRTVFLRHGFEQVQCTYVNATKNAVDMQLAVDALEAALDAGDALEGVVLVTADSDFGPLARTLRRRGVTVIGIGWAAKAADLYRAQCDRFVDYETLLGDSARRAPPDRAPPDRAPPDRPPPDRPPPDRAAPERPAAVRPSPRPPRAAAPEPEQGDRPFLYDPREGAAPPEDADAEPPDGEEEGYAFFETDTGQRR